MTLLILGLILWILSHMFKRLAPGAAQRMDENRRKTGVSVLSLVAIVLMVIGFRGWQADVLYVMPDWTVRLNNLLMLVSVYLMAAAGMKTAITRRVRHPQSTGVILWSVAHLLVRGDWAVITLFGGLLLWAVAAIALENAQTEWRPASGPISKGKEIGAIVGAVIVTGAIGYVHVWLGLAPFGG